MDNELLIAEIKAELKEEFKWVMVENADFLPNCIKITVGNNEVEFISIFKSSNDLKLMNARKENLVSHLNDNIKDLDY